jgi:streptogramin lyase
LSLARAGTVGAAIAGVEALHDTNDTYGIAADDTDVWVYDGEDGMLTRIATGSEKVVGSAKLRPGCQNGAGCGNVAIGAGAVWVANDADGTITRVDPATNEVAATISFGDRAAPLVYATSGAIWSANYVSRSFSRIDPATNKITATVPDRGGAESVVSGFGSIWLCGTGGPQYLTRVDPITLAVQAQIDLSHNGTAYSCIDEAATGQSILVGAASTVDDGALLERVDPAINRVSDAGPAPGSEGVGLVATATQAWTADAARGVFGLDPRNGRPDSQLPIPKPAGLAVGAGSVWIVSASGSVYRVAPAG